jgi:hypothetical protein
MCVQSESMEFVGHHFDQELGARNARSLDMTRCKVWICISLAVSESEHSVLQSGGVSSSPEVDNDTENLWLLLCRLTISVIFVPQFGRSNLCLRVLVQPVGA